MNLAEFDYELPDESIAQEPLDDRAGARMLVVDRAAGSWQDCMFRDLPGFLRRGDCLVVNDSRVFPSRLLGRRAGSEGAVEVFLLKPVTADAGTWQALVRPGRRMQLGARLRFGEALEAEIVGRGEYGERTLRFDHSEDLYERLNAIGHVPLPPYIKRPDTQQDRDRYQTVFARESGSVAAPTAGLHFTADVLASCEQAGASLAHITLHVGLGTFQPVRGETLHAERFEIRPEEAQRIMGAERVVCAGTTSVRAVESMLLGKSGETDLFIRPGFEFRKTGAMLTNFHLPQSSLLMLVCAFGGKDLILEAYRHAVAGGYRFYSYGDCMLVN